jgi:hypothetical protein
MTSSDERPDDDGRSTRESDGERSRDEQVSHDSGTTFGIDTERVGTALRWGVLFVLGIVILVAGAGLYSSLGSIIDIWIADRYQPFARAGVNFALLCGAVAGVVATLRRQ